MKLSKLYSNHSEMNPIIFNDGFNVIFGDVEDNEQNKGHEHNLGKSSLVYLIDFLLLKKNDGEDIFVKYAEKFSGWSFFLEIELNSGKFVTVKRSVNESSKISFKLHSEKDADFTAEPFWDYSEKSLSSKKDENALEIFKSLIGFDVLEDYNFRQFLGYLLRTQKEYNDVFKLDKFRGKHIVWKPFLFSLFGFDGELLKKKYELDADADMSARAKTKMESENLIESEEDLYGLKVAVAAKEREKEKLLENVDKFNFFSQEQNLNHELVDDIESKIARLNSEAYAFAYEIDKIGASLKNNTSFDLNAVKEIFEDVKIFFPENLSKSYEELVKFNEQISSERFKYLKEELKDIEEKFEITKISLKELNAKRSEALSFLQERDSFKRFKNYQQEVFNVEAEIIEFKRRIEGIDSIEKFNKKIAELATRANELAKEIKNNRDAGSDVYQVIEKIFEDAFSATLNATAIISIGLNKNGNVEFKPLTISKEKNDFTGEGAGFTYTKVQCASFAMAVLIAYSDKSYFRFAYHDGVFDSWGDNPKRKFINLVREYCKQYKIQYIVSMIKSDVPRGFDLKKEEVVATLDEKNTLFGVIF